ncbi:MFS transporter [Marinactinospora thermotolerans]|uniref:Predicted arabinose efflux permease, MFS family n=1 Tax=Marinactinospora thermotolerans DSM 45154 TaxID=1122192 RepID=A0A1T4PH21_9ACTN|nr:MFS transporter [Marinactinospora thermotolerans]SJZ90825.1 Predicted arabinose efflux permease, MFS family [Marinactinospora thermotolerans DSM 45154]
MLRNSALARAAERTPYWPVLTHPLLRRILPGIGVSALGGGMSSVAVSWLAISLAPADQRAVWVTAAVTAYVLPGTLGVLVFGRLLNGRSGAQLAGWDAILRAVALAAIPLLHMAGALDVLLYVVLLGVSSLFSAWGKAGRYTMLSELLPREHHLAGNAVVNVMLELSTVVGPLLAALVIEHGGPEHVLGLVALSFAVLAATYRFAVPADHRTSRVEAGASRSEGLRAIVRDPALLGLLLLSFGFFLFFGPSTVAIPIHVVEDLGAPASVLAGFYTAFGVGAVAGALLAGYLRRVPLLPATTVIILGFGGALAGIGLGPPVIVSWVCFGLCGLFWGPFPATTTALFQRSADPGSLPQVLAARGALTGMASPLGAMAATPLLIALGAQGVLLVSGLTLLGLGVTALTWAALTRTGRAPSTDPARRER